MNQHDIIQALKDIPRVDYRVADDGDGRVDEWESESPTGDYVRYSDLLPVITRIEQEVKPCSR